MHDPTKATIRINNNLDEQIYVKYHDFKTDKKTKIFVNSDKSATLYAIVAPKFTSLFLTMKVPHTSPPKIEVFIHKEYETLTFNNPQDNVIKLTDSEWKIIKKLQIQHST
jgi:hypothetical protein